MPTLAKGSRTLTSTIGSTTPGPFSLGFRLFDTDGLEVYVNDVARTDYTISATFSGGYTDSATITFDVDLSAGDELVVHGKMAADREEDLLPGSSSLIAKVNIELARHAAMIQENQRDVARSLKVISGDAGAIPVENSSFIGFNSSGTLQTFGGASNVPVSSAMVPVVEASTLQAARRKMKVDYIVADFTELDGRDDVAVGDTILVTSGYNGESEIVKIKAAATYTANSQEVYDLTASGLQAVSTRMWFKTFADMDADTRGDSEFTDGDVVTAGDIRFEKAGSSDVDVHVENAAGVGFRNLDFAKTARRHTARLMRVLETDERDATIVVTGDSTGNATDEWVYLFAGYFAPSHPAFTVKYYLWDDGTSSYGAATTIQTGTGSNTLHIYNCSVAGKEWDYTMGARFTSAVATPSPDLIITSYGHNGTDVVNLQANAADALLSKMARFLPDTPVIVIGQNAYTSGTPNFTSDGSQEDKTEAFRAVAARRGAGFIDIMQAFLASPSGLPALHKDAAHPNADGSKLWAKSVLTAFESEPGAAGISGGQAGQLIAATTLYSDFARWNVTGAGMTVSEEATHFETTGSAVNLTNTAGANGSIYFDFLGADDIESLKGQYVTMSVRIKVITDDGSETTGRVALHDGVNTATTRAGGPGGSDFYWQSVSILVDGSADKLRGYIYASTASGAAEIVVDRLNVVTGLGVAENFGPPSYAFGQHLSLIGSDFDGTLVVQNTGYSTRGITGVEQAFDWATGDPGTDYTWVLGGESWGFKGAGDSYDRIGIDPANGRILFGVASAAPAIRLNATSATRLRLTGGTLEPDGDNTRSLGLNGLGWSNVITHKVQLEGSTSGPEWTSGSGSPEGVVTAVVGSLYSRTDGGASTTLYVKESGAGNTGWVAK